MHSIMIHLNYSIDLNVFFQTLDMLLHFNASACFYTFTIEFKSGLLGYNFIAFILIYNFNETFDLRLLSLSHCNLYFRSISLILVVLFLIYMCILLTIHVFTKKLRADCFMFQYTAFSPYEHASFPTMLFSPFGVHILIPESWRQRLDSAVNGIWFKNVRASNKFLTYDKITPNLLVA